MLTYMCVVRITTPPENTTVCRGDRVIISCGYNSPNELPVTWIINGTSFTEDDIVNNRIYQLNNHTTPNKVSLTVSYISHTTTFQCIVNSTPDTTTSRPGTVIVTTGTYSAYIMCYNCNILLSIMRSYLQCL